MDYRARYRRDRIPGWYNGWVHVAFVVGCAVGLGALAVGQISGPSWGELALIPVVFVFANLVEYLVHRFPMHRALPGVRFMVERHAGMHHRYYTHETIKVDDHRDFATVLFPPQMFFVFFGVISLPVAAALALFSWNAAAIYTAVAMAYYLNYEFLHLAYHLDPDGFVGRLPGMATLRRAHTHHHDPSVMHTVNFNITYPIMDVVFGTFAPGPERVGGLDRSGRASS